MITYRFNETLQILEVKYKGCITLEDLMEFGNWVATNRELPRELKILTVASDAEYKLVHKDFNKLLLALEHNCRFYSFIKAAYIHHKPMETAYSYLLYHKKNIPNYHHAVFSTYEAAIDWLLK